MRDIRRFTVIGALAHIRRDIRACACAIGRCVSHRGQTIAGGGATLGGGSFRLSGTVGQPAALLTVGLGSRVYDGFWAPAAPAGDLIFADGFDPQVFGP